MPKLPSPPSNFPLAVRVLRLAESLGYRGEGAISLPLQDPQGQGIFNLIVTADTSLKAPSGSIMFNSTSNEFMVSEVGEGGAVEWKNVGANPDLHAVMLEHPGDAQGSVIPLKPLPPVIDPVAPDNDNYDGIYEPQAGDPAAEAINEQGDLFHLGLSSEGMVTTENGELSVSTAVRMDNGAHVVSPTDNGVYDVNVQMSPSEVRDWCVPISAVLTSKINGDCISTMYDLTITVRAKRSGRKLLFKAVWAGGKMEFEDSQQGVRIPDTFSDATGAVVQALFYPHQYMKYLGIKPQDQGDSGALIGEYEIFVDAKRIKGQVTKLECHVTATVSDFIPDDYSFIVPSTAVANSNAPASMCNEDGYLLTGTGNPAWNLLVATNGELTMFGGCRYHNTLQQIQSTTTGVPKYSINVNASENALKDWTWLIGGQMVNVANASAILDRYAVQLRITKLGADAVVLDGSFVDGKFVFANADDTMTFDDSTTDAEGGLFENIQRIGFWPDVFDPQYGTINTNAVIGTYDFELVAIRDRGDVPPLLCAWSVDVVDERLDDTSFIVAPQTVLNGAIPAGLTKSNGTQFLNGTGNPIKSLIAVTNGELALVGGSRFYRKDPTPAGAQIDEAEQGNPPFYALNVHDSPYPTLKDWTWLYGIALIDTRNSKTITELYDVTLTARDLGTGKSLNFVGSFVDNVWHFIDEANSLDIVDNTTNVNGTVCANIQRVTFYKQLLESAIGDSGAPTGDFEFTLSAVRKYGDFRLENKWVAHITDIAPPPPAPEPEPEPEPEADPVVDETPVDDATPE